MKVMENALYGGAVNEGLIDHHVVLTKGTIWLIKINYSLTVMKIFPTTLSKKISIHLNKFLIT